MNYPGSAINQLSSIRNSFGNKSTLQKLTLLKLLENEPDLAKKDLRSLNANLLFLLAYPQNKTIYKQALKTLEQLHLFVKTNEKIKAGLYNSGITNTQLCASFSFELVKWMKQNFPDDIRLSEIEAGDGQIQSILSAVMPKIESEILQDGNASWKPWLLQSLKKDETLLDSLIAVFDTTNIRPEVKDELWTALGINVEIYFSHHTCLPDSLFVPYYHQALISKKTINQQPVVKPTLIQVSVQEAEHIIQCARIVLMRQLREIDPITFTTPKLVSLYKLDRGICIALMDMQSDRRHPIDSYIGYMVFKNGLPVAYAGSWILFDSARIGLNVFPEYRGGESAYIFHQVLNLHKQVYKLNRFTVDPYQLGKDNADGIHSGAFWLYYHAGYRPVAAKQKELAVNEAKKINEIPGYRTSSSVLKILADSRMEKVINKKSVRFDATDCSRAYAGIIKDQFNNNRKQAESFSMKKLLACLQEKKYRQGNMQYVLSNWSVLLFNKDTVIQNNTFIKNKLKIVFELKAHGNEADYIKEMQQFSALRKYLEKVVKGYML